MCVVVVVMGAGRHCGYSGKALVPGSCRAHFPSTLDFRIPALQILTPSLTLAIEEEGLDTQVRHFIE